VNKTPPDLYAHLDYRAYLAQWFDWKKSVHAGYSHRLFARKAGQKSPSLLKAVIDGKRNLTAATTEAFGQALGLDFAAARFFAALVKLGQADSDSDRNEAWAVISATKRFRDARHIEGEAFRFFSHWWCVAVFELVKHPDFRPEPRWIARTLRPRIKESEARQALKTLRELGLVTLSEAGGMVQAQASVITPQEVSGLAVSNYHREMCARAGEAVGSFDAAERHMLSVTVTVPDALLPELKRELNAMQARLLDLCDSQSDPAGRVSQINLQLFPLASRMTDD
jgi:uncharacterized protein (TIGR02147 family)